MSRPSINGPTPIPPSRKIKNVEVANPTLLLGAALIAEACALETKVENPRPTNAPAIRIVRSWWA